MNRHIKDYHTFNTELILINGYQISVRRSNRLNTQKDKDKFHKTFSNRFKKQFQNRKNYHVHYHKRADDKIFYCTNCNGFRCCNLCPDCNSKIYSNSVDFSDSDDLTIDSEITSISEIKNENNISDHNITLSNNRISSLLDIFFN